MAVPGTESSTSGMGLDLTQFYQVFFEEAGENLSNMEQLLLELDVQAADDEALNAIFRCAHSIKGGAATFGFSDVAELTHEMETLLDKLRRHELQPTTLMVDVLLASGDALKAQLAVHQGLSHDCPVTSELLGSIRAMVSGEVPASPGTPVKASAASGATAQPTSEASSTGLSAGAGTAPSTAEAVSATAEARAASVSNADPLPDGHMAHELVVGPLDNPVLANHLADLFKEIPGLGSIEPLDGGLAQDGLRRFKVITSTSESDLADLFSFHVAREQVRFLPWGTERVTPGYGFFPENPGVPQDACFGIFEGAPGAPVARSVADSPANQNDAPGTVANQTGSTPHLGPATSRPAGARTDAKAPTAEATTLRVAVDKIDQLINLVGELVITQAMLAQTSRDLDPVSHQPLLSGLADLERNTRDLQESVMSIRMIPMATVFNRFPRMLRDLASRLGKQVELVTQGEATELDKGLVEKITDPLTHLVRNSCDHGIELPAERLAAGKPEHGTLTLAASHQGGSILIEVRDDGRGLSREKIMGKARERGLAVQDSMSDGEVWNLIFEPGFSTAAEVTDVSGRGVGMDVVKRNITSLGGSVEIDSAEGFGMRVSVRLPLTLAIMDGMSVAVGDEVYILPLASVVESFQVENTTIKTIGGHGRVVEVRDEFMPVVELEQLLGVPRLGGDVRSNIMVVVEAEGGRVALMVDELIGQQQVVVKNLESNYRKVQNVSGATILGDGRVALILDAGSMVRRTRH